MGYATPTKYTEKMPGQLVEMFKRGESRAHFCSKHSISSRTFKVWLDKHKEFSEAYEIAKEKAQEWFLNKAMAHIEEEQDPEAPTTKLNTTLWSMIMRNRFDFTEHRKLKVPGLAKAKNFVEQLQAILQELANGNLTASEATQLSKLVEVGMKVFEVTELERRVAQIEQGQRIGASDDEFKLEPEKV